MIKDTTCDQIEQVSIHQEDKRCAPVLGTTFVCTWHRGLQSSFYMEELLQYVHHFRHKSMAALVNAESDNMANVIRRDQTAAMYSIGWD